MQNPCESSSSYQSAQELKGLPQRQRSCRLIISLTFFGRVKKTEMSRENPISGVRLRSLWGGGIMQIWIWICEIRGRERRKGRVFDTAFRVDHQYRPIKSSIYITAIGVTTAGHISHFVIQIRLFPLMTGDR